MSMTPPTGAEQDTSARAIIERALTEYGLGGLSARYWERYLNNGGNLDQLFLDIRKEPEYITRFPAIGRLAEKGRALSEREYIELEKTYVELNRRAGLPSGFYDSPEDFADLIENDVAPTEYAGRLKAWTAYTYQSDPVMREELGRLYDATPGDITAYLMDATRALPLIEQQFLTAEISAASRRSSYGTLTREEAEQLTNRGVTKEDADKGFEELVNLGELFDPNIGDDAESFGKEAQLNSAFGQDVATRNKVKRRGEERSAEFQGGGGYAAGRGSVAGLGRADK